MKFISIVMSWSENLEQLSKVENYHLMPLEVARDLGMKPILYICRKPKKIPKIKGVEVKVYQNPLEFVRFLHKHNKDFIYANCRIWQSYLSTLFGKVRLFMNHDSVKIDSWWKRKINNFFMNNCDAIRVINEEEVKVLIAESTKTESDLKQKIVSLNTEISTNAKKQHTEVVKITRPDGTIEEHTITDTSEESMNQRIVDMKKETEQQVKTEIAKVQEEFTKKEEQIKTESNKIVATLQVTIEKQKSQIDELIKKETIVSINPKAVGIEAGIASDLMYRFGANYNVLGPIYIGIQTDSDFKTKVRPGITIGVRF